VRESSDGRERAAHRWGRCANPAYEERTQL
jgi:hypothetical protein